MMANLTIARARYRAALRIAFPPKFEFANALCETKPCDRVHKIRSFIWDYAWISKEMECTFVYSHLRRY